MNQPDRPAWYLLAVPLILALGLILSSYIVTDGIVKTKTKTITVTGSVKKQLKSDLIIWRGSFSTTSLQIPEAYQALKGSSEKVKNYLISKGIAEKDLVFSSISTVTNMVPLPDGMYSNKVESYRLMQTVEVSSPDVDKLTTISREATELINSGVAFESYPPQYFYTKIADLKVELLGLATKDAKTRAEQIAKSTGSQIGNLRAAKMGVFQITPMYSTEVSDAGINDTSSIDKEITGVITCDFEIK